MNVGVITLFHFIDTL